MMKLDDEFFAKYDAILFDLDGVLTDTARLHAVAWKRMFDAYLNSRFGASGLQLFNPDLDYRAYVDGKPRYDGVKAFLEARGIALPWGDASDPPEADTICGLGNRKDVLVNEILEKEGVFAFPGSVALLRRVHEKGTKLAVVSSSKNSEAVLRMTGLQKYFSVRVDGKVAEQMDLPGKPAPDMFLEAARRLEVEPKRSVVIEDALAGVQSARSGGFGFVIGISRHGEADGLKAAGADLVVPDLEVFLDEETDSSPGSHPA